MDTIMLSFPVSHFGAASLIALGLSLLFFEEQWRTNREMRRTFDFGQKLEQAEYYGLMKGCGICTLSIAILLAIPIVRHYTLQW